MSPFDDLKQALHFLLDDQLPPIESSDANNPPMNVFNIVMTFDLSSFAIAT